MRRTKALERLGVCLALLIVPFAVNADGDDGRLRVEVLNIENDKGQIGCSLFEKAVARKAFLPRGSIVIHFSGLFWDPVR